MSIKNIFVYKYLVQVRFLKQSTPFPTDKVFKYSQDLLINTRCKLHPEVSLAD